jgi:N-acetylneuraminic acid mutarotase
MRQLLSLSAALALGSFALASCGDETTQPNTVADQPTIPQLAVAPNSWITRANMDNRTDLATATLTNAAGQSIVYAIGGLNPNRVPLKTVTAYNVATNTWTFRHALPVPLAFSNGAGVINGKIYVSGGLSNYNLDDLQIRLYMYDPAANTWTRKHDLPIIESRYGDFAYLFGAGGATGVIGGKLYVFTACFWQNWEPLAHAEESCDRGPGFFRYNPVTDRWTILPSPFGAETRSPYAGGVIGGKFYVMGGSVNTTAGWFAVYDPATNQWTPKTSLALARPGAATAVLDSKLYVIGGRRFNATREAWETLDVTIVYDPITDAWTRRASLPSPRAGIAGSKVFLNGQPRIEVVGGARPGNNLQYIP